MLAARAPSRGLSHSGHANRHPSSRTQTRRTLVTTLPAPPPPGRPMPVPRTLEPTPRIPGQTRTAAVRAWWPSGVSVTGVAADTVVSNGACGPLSAEERMHGAGLGRAAASRPATASYGT